MVELLPGTGVYVYKDQMLEALKAGLEADPTQERSGEKMSRYLLGLFYTSRELVGSTLSQGNINKHLLNPVITETIIGKPLSC